MNFKKYHVSRNLWDNRGFSATTITLNNIHNISNNYGTTLSTTEGDEVTITQSAYPTGNTGYQNGFFMIDVDFSKYAVGDVVTISFDYIVNEVHALSTQTATTVYAGKNSNTVPAFLSSGDWKVSGRLTAVITIIAGMNPYVEVRLCGNSITVKNIMLNSGSTALPYEPYSSEVWHDIPHYVHKTSTDTITTLPAVLYPNAATATVGLKGQAVQSTTPTPQNPVMPQGTGERTVNLFNKNDVENKIVSREGVENISNYYILSTFISVDNGVTVSATKLLTDPIRIIRYDANKQFISRTDENTADNIVVDDCAYIRINANKDHWNINTIQVEYGRTATSYEPYGYKIPISSASTTTPVYLGEVQTTRKIKKLVLTGKENIGEYDSAYNRFSIIIRGSLIIGVRLSPAICSHYQAITDGREIANVPNNAIYSDAIIGNSRWFIKTTDYTTVVNFKSYLAAQYAAGTPVTVWYVLATKETAVVNEPLMKIGTYADEVSNVSIPVTAGGDTISVDTTVQPSEVTVNYKGWHPVADVHERESGQWT